MTMISHSDMRPAAYNPWNNPNPEAVKRVSNPLPAPECCPNCRAPVELVNNADVYGRSLGKWPFVFLCTRFPSCQSWVGLHPETHIPLGTLGDRETRAARNTAKGLLKRIWLENHMSRGDAHRWLSKQLGFADVRDCHIGLMSVKQCGLAHAACQKYLRGKL
jgi:hypothetical protein